MHFDLDNAVTLTGFTSAALDIKRKPPRAKSVLFRFVRLRKQLSDIRKHACISCRIGTGCSSDGRLIDVDDFI